MLRLIPAALVVAFAAAFAVVGQEKTEKPQRTDTEKKAMAQVQKLGGLCLEIAQNDPHLEVSYLQKETKFSSDYLVPLKDLKGLVHLNLRGQDITDEQMVYLKDLKD